MIYILFNSIRLKDKDKAINSTIDQFLGFEDLK